MDDKNFLSVTAGALAMAGIRKKDVARQLGLSPSAFSEVLSGTRPLTHEVRQQLTDLLHLQPVIDHVETELGHVAN